MAKWMVAAKKADFEAWSRRFKIDPVIARLIRNRDITTEAEVEQYLNEGMEGMHSPFLMSGMEQAVELILHKIQMKKKIRIIGDYDIDGVCATYILKTGLTALGADTDAAIPHRQKDGYGLSDGLIKQAAADGTDTILTCDNGISAAPQIALANSLGMTVLVTDHHEVPFEEKEDGSRIQLLPEAAVILDPRQEGCGYPFPGICGAVVAYKLIEALFQTKKYHDESLTGEFLGFAAFATIGDVMELRDENRILVKYGLHQLQHTANQGMKALMEANGLGDKKLTPYHIGYVLGPCLNAGGRLDTAVRALELLETADARTAAVYAGELRSLNDSRKDMTAKGLEEACRLIESQNSRKDKVLVIYLPDCHESLAGIIAGRLREKYNRPAFVLTGAEEGLKGSGRSVEAYSMYEQISACRELFTRYGGHKMAAGLSMKKENLDLFRRTLNENCPLTEEDYEETVHIDVPMPLSYVNEKLIGQLSCLEPFGPGNPKPLFAQKNLCIVSGRIFGKNLNVGKYTAEDEAGNHFELIYFGDLERFDRYLAEKYGERTLQELYGTGAGLNIKLDVAYYPQLNEYKGRTGIQFVMQYYS